MTKKIQKRPPKVKPKQVKKYSTDKILIVRKNKDGTETIL